MKKAYDLTPSELVNSPLADLARKAGYASLKSMLNEGSMWGEDLEKVSIFLSEQVAE